MWTPPDSPLAIDAVSAALLRELAAAFRSGQLTAPLTPFGLQRVASCPAPLAADLRRLGAEGMSSAHLALLLDVAATAAEARLARESAAELVWSGPKAPQSRSRDT